MRAGNWKMSQLHGGQFVSIVDLWLYPELECSSCVQDCDADGPAQLKYYVEYIKRKYPAWWESDAVPIYWSGRGEGSDQIFEEAPCGNEWMHARLDLEPKSILTEYSVPYDIRTGEPINWWRLPVRNTRFPEFAKALGWLPSPFQQFAPLRSIVTNAVCLPARALAASAE
jgi:hypothetical protein